MPTSEPVIQHSDPVFAKTKAGGRLSPSEALELFRNADLEQLSPAASQARESRHGRNAYYVINRHINYSNICVLDCDFCAFGKRRREEGAYEFSLEEMVERARLAARAGAAELHIVGGLHPSWPFERYLEMLQALGAVDADLTLKAFTAVEVLHLSQVAKLDLETTLSRLKDAGLRCLTGGGAEIFAPEVRRRICRGKETAEEWLEVHRTAHRLGIRSTATMLFGHLESLEDRVDHLRQLRELPEETNGFIAFLPLSFQPAHRLSHLSAPSEEEMLRTIAVSRLFLDNFDHIKAYWISYGLELATRALRFGADDLDGTIEEERIYHMAGSQAPVSQSVENLRAAIMDAGLQPVLRDSFYRPLESN